MPFPKNVITAIVVVSTVFVVIYFLVTMRFFRKTIPYDFTIQTFAVFIFVMLYFRELIKSDELLEFYKSHLFYISLGLMLWYLCLTPLFIFDRIFMQLTRNLLCLEKTICLRLTYFYIHASFLLSYFHYITKGN